jgi:glycosyltransferase involved in cell wall biosynthesis
MPMLDVHGELTARYPHLFDFFLSLGAHTSVTWLCLPLRRADRPRSEYGPVEPPPNVRILGLPHWSSAASLARRVLLIVPVSLWRIARNLRHWDVVGAVVPSIVGDMLVFCARASGRPVFLLVRGEKQRTLSWIMGPGLRTRRYLLALRLMERPVRRWVAAGVPTFVAGDELRERYVGPDARIYDLYPALSRDFPIAPAPRPARAGRPLRLVTVARLSPEKGIDDLLAAMELLARDGRDVRLVVAGDGPDAGRLRALASHRGVADRVRFAGFVPHGRALVALLDEADAFVLPSRSEGLPHSLVEALARGLPAIVSDVGGMPRLLAGGAGVVVAQQRPDELARAVAALADDPGERERLSARSLEVAGRLAPEAQLTELRARLSEAYPALEWGEP